MSFNVGDVATLDYDLTVDGVPTSATVTLTVTAPSGAVSAPTVTSDGVGSYTANVTVTEAGAWAYRWAASGAATDVETGTFSVGTGLGLHDLKARLNKTLNVDDAELQQMLDAALAEYAAVVGPVGTTTVDYYGGPTPYGATDVVFKDAAGNVVEFDYRYGSPYLYWNEPLGAMGHGLYSTGRTITYTRTIPTHHREAILADVAGYFAATQRGNAAGALPTGGYESGYEERTTPLVLFPRIRALAATISTVA